MIFSLFLWSKLTKNCDIIHTTTHTALIPAKIFSIIHKKKIVVTVHEVFGRLWYDLKWILWFFYLLFELISLKLNFNCYICPSKNTTNDLISKIGISKNKIEMIYNWIDYNFWNKNNFNWEKTKYRYDLQNNFVWLYYGRCDKLKWLDYYIDAIQEIILEIPEFKTIIIANGSIQNKMHFRNLILLKDIDEHIIWIDWVEYEKLWNFILAADFVIVPSLSEWFCFVAAETCALKQNIIVSKAGSLTEIASWKVNYFEKWNIEEIINAIKETYKWNFKIIPSKTFSIEENIKMHEKIYEKMLW